MLPVVTMECRAGADPTLTFSQSGVAVCKVRVAASSRRKDGDQWVDDKTTWITVTAFKQLAENVAESIVKGDLILVTGKLQMEEWEKDGVKHTGYSVIADTIGPSIAFKPARSVTVERKTMAGGDPWAGQQPPPAAPQADEPPF